MASAAEERIRTATVSAMRRRWPSARIIHELVLDQGCVRIDVAAVTEDHIALAEIKSELDVLKRLPRQLPLCTKIAGETWLVIAPKHVEAVDELRWNRADLELAAAVRASYRLVERNGVLTGDNRGLDSPVPDVRAMLMMLWAAELQAIARKVKPRFWCMREIVEHMSGREIRRAVCAALRRRPFARADDPIGAPASTKTPTLYTAPPPAAPVDWAKWCEDAKALAAAMPDPRIPDC